MSDALIGESNCEHGISTSKACVECRLELTQKRLESLEGKTGLVAASERDMHLNDIKLLTRMLVNGKRVL